MKANNNSPAIRFAGFVDAWKQSQLGDNYARIGNAFVGTATPYYVNEGHLYLESNNIKNGHINRNTEVFINDEFYIKQKEKWLHTGDIVMVQSGHVGHTAVIPEELNNSAAHALIVFQSPKKQVNPHFLNYEFQTSYSKNKIDNITTGNTIKHILASDMKAFIVSLPSSNEQNTIGAFFQNIDSLVHLHQRKYEKLVNLKKVMLDKMFPKNGELVPEVRFAGFSGNWERREAREMFVSKADKGHPELPVLAATQDRGMIRRDENSITVYHDKKNEEGYKRVKPGQFVIHLRSFQGGFAHSKIEGITSPAYTVFEHANPDIHNSEYWKYVFTSNDFIKRLETVTYGIRDGRSISYEEFLTMDFTFPNREEQGKIAALFDCISKLISLQQIKYERLINLKNAFLEKMFV